MSIITYNPTPATRRICLQPATIIRPVVTIGAVVERSQGFAFGFGDFSDAIAVKECMGHGDRSLGKQIAIRIQGSHGERVGSFLQCAGITPGRFARYIFHSVRKSVDTDGFCLCRTVSL